MALGDPYATLVELKRYLLGQVQAAADTLDDTELTDVLGSVSTEIEDHCDRQFNQVTVATARTFYPASRSLASVHDFYTVTDLVVATDEDDDGTFETTWTATDYQLEPLDGVVNGRPGWPFYKIRAVGDRRFPAHSRRVPLRVTAQWGWVAVPKPVHQACLILAAETHKLRSAPFGVAGFGEFGVVRVRDNPMAAKKLRPYELRPVLVA